MAGLIGLIVTVIVVTIGSWLCGIPEKEIIIGTMVSVITYSMSYIYFSSIK